MVFVLTVLRHPRKRRIVAALRDASPLSFFVWPYILGQLIGLNLGLTSLLLVIALINPRRSALWPILAGAVSILPIILVQPLKLKAATSYMVQVEDWPRYRKPGGVSVDLTLLGELAQDTDGRLDFQPISKVKVACSSADLPWKNLYLAAPGDLFIVQAKFVVVSATSRQFSYQAMLARKGYRATCKVNYALRLSTTKPKLIERLRKKIADTVELALGPSELSGLFRAMSVGGHDLITPDTEQAFKRVGLAHLLVVSGYQVTLVFVSVFVLLKFLTIWFRHFNLHLPIYPTAAIAGALTALAFVLLSGVEGSSLRAVLAVAITITTTLIERGRGLYNATLLSLLIIGAIWPGSILEPGIELTFAALFGIALGNSFPTKNILLRYLTITTMATLFTSVVIAFWFKTVSLGAIILNPLVGNVAAAVTCDLGLVAIVLGLTGLDPNYYLLKVCGLFVDSLRTLVVWVSELWWISFELDGLSLYLTIVGLLGLISYFIGRALSEFVLIRVGSKRYTKPASP